MNIEYLFIEKEYKRQLKVMDIQVKILFLILVISLEKPVSDKSLHKDPAEAGLPL